MEAPNGSAQNRRPKMTRSANTKNTADQPTKAEIVGKLLNSAKGASIGEIAQTTGWQPHSCRAFLTGLRKKGHSIIRAKRKDDTSYYRIDKKSVPASTDATKTPDDGGTVSLKQEAA
ncbi:MAG: DUF3489 domain-containing protein [Parasphingorhabdus sp.]